MILFRRSLGSMGRYLGGGEISIWFPIKKNSVGRFNRSMNRFLEVLNEVNIVDVPLLVGLFTWSGSSGNQRLARLDRFFSSQEWMDHFGLVKQRKLSQLLIMHPLANGGGGRNGPTPFTFENIWLKYEVESRD